MKLPMKTFIYIKANNSTFFAKCLKGTSFIRDIFAKSNNSLVTIPDIRKFSSTFHIRNSSYVRLIGNVLHYFVSRGYIQLSQIFHRFHSYMYVNFNFCFGSFRSYYDSNWVNMFSFTEQYLDLQGSSLETRRV